MAKEKSIRPVDPIPYVRKRDLPPPVEQRVCAEPGCSTVLSRYNDRDRCWAHQEEDTLRRLPRKEGI